MLPVETPPDRSCSSNVSVAVRSDERASDSGTLLEADPTASLNLAHQRSTTHFSIRDYAFTSRSKDIGINWPFPRQYLQVCLKHGVKDLLPPFEPPDLVRANYSTKGKRSEQLVISIDDARRLKSCIKQKKSISKLDIISEDKLPEHHLLSSTSGLESSGKLFSLVPLKSKSEASGKGLLSRDKSGIKYGEIEIEHAVSVLDLAKTDRNLPSEVAHSEIGSVTHSEVTLEASLAKVLPLPGRLDVIQKPSLKKCRSVLKVGSLLEPLRSSDISSTSSMVSDSMASKVCPVCKRFSSTSNTTLNAHIDQCLFENTNNNEVPSKLLKHKVKPSKKRLIVDIYATAARCTLEDLDKRNGTTWSLNLISMAPTNMISTETKRLKICPVSSNDDENDGAVYVDSSGTKVCILSKLNTKPLHTVGESSEVKTHIKEIEKQNKIFCKRRTLTSKHSRLAKVKFQGKETIFVKFPNDKVKVTSEDKLPKDVDLGKEGPEPLLQKHFPKTETVNCRIATLRQKIRSVQSGPSKRLNGSHDHDLSRKQVVEANQLDSVSSSLMKIHARKLHGPVTDINFLKTKSMKILSGSLLEGDCSAKIDVSPENNARKLVSGLSSNCSRTLGGSSSSPSIRTVDDTIKQVVKNAERVPDPASKTILSCHFNPAEGKDNPISTECPSLTKSSFLSEDDCDSRKAQFASKKLRSPRSMKKFSKKTTETRCVVNYEFHEMFDIPSPSNYQAVVTDQSSLCEKIFAESSRQSTSTVGVECKSSEGPELRGGCHNLDRKNAGLSTDFKGDDVYNGGKSQLSDTTGNYTDTEIVDSETAQLHTCDGNMDTDSSLGENQKLIGGTEAWVELFASRTSSNQRIHCGDEGSAMVINPNGEVADEMEFRRREYACSEVQYIEFQNDHNEHIWASNACLTSPRISCLDSTLEHSCVTSNRTLTNNDYNIVTKKETSGSPVSAASTISQPSSEEEKISARPLVTNDYSRAEFYENLELPLTANSMTDGTASIWKQLQGSESNIVVHGGVNLWEKQSCCCSHRESVPHESRLSTQCSLDKLVVVPSTSCFNSMPVEPSGYSIRADMGVETKSADFMSPRSCSDEPFGYRTCKDFVSDGPNSQVQTQSSSKPVLRLMGKNLTVANEDDHLQLIKDSPFLKDVPGSGHHPSLLNHSSNDSFPISNNHQFQNLQFIEGYELMEYGTKPSFQALPISSFIGTSRQDQINTHQRMFCEASSSPFTCNEKGVLLHHQHKERPFLTRSSGQPREALMIDDPPDPKMLSRGGQPSMSIIYSGAPSSPCPMPIIPSCIRTPYTYLSRDLSYTPNPGFSVSYLRSSNAHSMLRRNPSEAPFVVPSLSAGHPKPTYFYSPSLQQGQ